MTGRPDRNDESESERFRIAEVSIHKEYLRKRHHDIAVLGLRGTTAAPAVLLPTEGGGRDRDGARQRASGRRVGWDHA